MAAVRFCSACGTQLESPPPITCRSCGVSHWRNPKPCANAVVVDRGKVLLVRRAQPPWEDAWGCPGGFCEIGEHPIETAEREVLEETGLRIAVTGYIGVWVDPYADDPGQPDVDVINVAFYHAISVGVDAEWVDDGEVREVRWFGWDDVPSELAPLGTLTEVLAAARRAHEEGSALAPLPDRPA